MSLTLEEISALDSSVRQRIKNLKDEVMNERSPFALISLLDLAILTTRSLHDLWSDFRPRRLFSESSERELERRRESLRYFVKWGDEFPILHSWSGDTDDGQERMLSDLKCGPLSSKSVHQSNMRQFIENVVMPAFAEIQHMPNEPELAIERKILRLPPLSYESRNKWADTIVQWSCLKWGDQMRKKGAILWDLAKPERELERERRKAAKRSRAMAVKLKKQSGIGELDFIAKTKLQKKQDYFRAKRVSDSHFKAGLKAQIAAYLGRNLSAKNSSP